MGAFLSPTAEVYSPVLGTRKIYKGEKDEVEYEFVKGNHPHWFNYKGHSCSEIVFRTVSIFIFKIFIWYMKVYFLSYATHDAMGFYKNQDQLCDDALSMVMLMKL